MNALKRLLAGHKGRAFVVTDSNVERLVLDGLKSDLKGIDAFPRFVIEPGEQNKSVVTVQHVWEWLFSHDASRSDIVLNIGGGMVTDIGGFAAATFKRGLPYANLATTLLGAADASVGGKTGVNFMGGKNIVGAFAMPVMTAVCHTSFSTLPRAELLSGYGEILKMTLVDDPRLLPRLLDIDELLSDTVRLGALAEEAAVMKMKIVNRDPHEKGLRKVLNFGHTFGHAFESIMTVRGLSLPHGVAVAHGIVVGLILSRMLLDAESEWLYRIATNIVSPWMQAPRLTCDDYPSLLDTMRADKKNTGDGSFRFVLLRRPGFPVPDVAVGESDLLPALDIYRDLISG